MDFLRVREEMSGAGQLLRTCGKRARERFQGAIVLQVPGLEVTPEGIHGLVVQGSGTACIAVAEQAGQRAPVPAVRRGRLAFRGLDLPLDLLGLRLRRKGALPGCIFIQGTEPSEVPHQGPMALGPRGWLEQSVGETIALRDHMRHGGEDRRGDGFLTQELVGDVEMIGRGVEFGNRLFQGFTFKLQSGRADLSAQQFPPIHVLRIVRVFERTMSEIVDTRFDLISLLL